MASVAHHVSPFNHHDDSYDDFMACCSDLQRLASDAEYEGWLSGIFPDRYEDEPPTDDTLMYDGPLFPPTYEDLDFLLGQRLNCLGMPETLAELDREIAEMRRTLEAKGGVS